MWAESRQNAPPPPPPPPHLMFVLFVSYLSFFVLFLFGFVFETIESPELFYMAGWRVKSPIVCDLSSPR